MEPVQRKPKLVRITTVPQSLRLLLAGQMKFMKEHGFEVSMVSSEGDAIADLEKIEGCRHYSIPFRREISLGYDLVSMVKLIILLKKLKPDIVHTHTPKAGLLGMWAARIAGVPVRLHTIAGLPWMETKGLKRLLLIWMERLTAFPAHRVYVNSPNLKAYLDQKKIAGTKLSVLLKGSSNGIDSHYFNKTAELEKEADAKLLHKNGLLNFGLETDYGHRRR